MISDTNQVSGPTIKRGKSVQEVGTDPKFIEAVLGRFGYIGFDLAASASNSKASLTNDALSRKAYFDKVDDSLKQKWNELECDGVMWLNPEYSDIEPWVAKCAAESALICKPILCLVPASVGANWWKEWVHPSAHAIFLNGRLTFDGHTQPYPKDLSLLVYFGGLTGDSIWRWK